MYNILVSRYRAKVIVQPLWGLWRQRWVGTSRLLKSWCPAPALRCDPSPPNHPLLHAEQPPGLTKCAHMTKHVQLVQQASIPCNLGIAVHASGLPCCCRECRRECADTTFSVMATWLKLYSYCSRPYYLFIVVTVSHEVHNNTNKQMLPGMEVVSQ